MGILYILGLLLRMPPWPLNKKQTMLWKLPVIVFTYSFIGRTPGLRLWVPFHAGVCIPYSVWHKEWNRSGPQICVHLWSLQGGKVDCHEIRQQWKVSHLKGPWRSQEAWAPWGDSPGLRNGRSGGSQFLPPRNPHTPLHFLHRSFNINIEGSRLPMNSNACLHLAVLLEENKKSKQNFEDQRFFAFFKKHAYSKDRPSVHSEGTPGHSSEGCTVRAGLLPEATQWPATKVHWPIYSACRLFLQEPRRGSPSSSDSS